LFGCILENTPKNGLLYLVCM